VHGLIRDIWERQTRALLFLTESSWAEKFWSDKRIDQPVVDSVFAARFTGESDDPDEAMLNEQFRAIYRKRSGLSHANSRGLVYRTTGMKPEDYEYDPVNTLCQSAGMAVLLGGLIGREIGAAFFADLLQQGLKAISTLILVLGDGSESLQGQYWELRKDIEKSIEVLDRN
jgi:hypothetical protein